LRAASSAAPPNAAAIDPPAPTTLIAENCEAPVKTNSDSAQVCITLAPALTDATPNERAKTPTAPLKVKLDTTTRRTAGSDNDADNRFTQKFVSLINTLQHLVGSTPWVTRARQHFVLNYFPTIASADFSGSMLKVPLNNRAQLISQSLISTLSQRTIV
jgi:hypothetical protein